MRSLGLHCCQFPTKSVSEGWMSQGKDATRKQPRCFRAARGSSVDLEFYRARAWVSCAKRADEAFWTSRVKCLPEWLDPGKRTASSTGAAPAI